MNISTWLKARIVLIVCMSALFSNAANAQQRANDPSILSIQRNKIDNTPSSIALAPGAQMHTGQEQELFSKYLGLSGSENRLVLKQTTTTKSNITTTRYTQVYKGIRVEHGSYTVTSKEGAIHFLSGSIYDFGHNPSAVPVVTASDAFGKALRFVGAELYMWQNPSEEARIKAMYHNSDTSYMPRGELVWVEDMRSGVNDRKQHLAYYFDIYAKKPLSRQQVYIDAQTGKVLFSNQLIKHTATTGWSLYSRNVPIQTAHVGTEYWLYDSTRGSGIYTLDMGGGTDYSANADFISPTNTWPSTSADSAAIDAHWGAEMVYDYWLTEQARLSWDGLDGILLQFVHYDVGYNNAFWDGAEMTYGDGTGRATGFDPLTSLDVTAHEIGHGVCQATANLIYEKEPGAMNEGFSDCWAATIEHWADPHEVDGTAKQYWKMGEEIDYAPMRSMDNPNTNSDPDTYTGTFWYNLTSCIPDGSPGGNDNCGVHTNSGVLNYWYYLLTIGGSGTNDLSNAYSVAAVGWTNAASILYQTELMLSSTSEYADCRVASINAATVLFGACSPEVASVTNAWYAVGIGPNYVPCLPEIGFVETTLDETEASIMTSCPASHTFSIAMKPLGIMFTGGSPTATLVTGGTAIPGVDYTVSPATVNFPVGDTSRKFVTITVYDNGAVNDDKTINLSFTLATGGSTAVISPTNGTMSIAIVNDDKTPETGFTNIYHTLNIGTPITSNNTSAFIASRRRAHSQFLLYADELTDAGVVPGVPISQIAFNVTSKNSTIPFTGYAISMGHTAVFDMSGGFGTGLTPVFFGSHTSNLGTDSVTFNTGTFTWNGTSNVIVEICFGMNASNAAANDQMSGIDHFDMVANYNSSNTGTGTGCTLPSNTLSTARPVMRFKQTIPPAVIETVAGSNRVWNVSNGQEVYFHHPADDDLIGGLRNITNDLGCTDAVVSQQGTGVVPAPFSPINRSRKEITITPAINGSITTYDVTMYMTTAELSGITPSTLTLVRTTSLTDAGVNTGNSVQVTPTLITGTNYTGFRGTFTGLGRYFLVDGILCSPPPTTITPAGPTTFCPGGSVMLNATTGAGLTYQWQVGGVNITGATTSSYATNASGSYQVTIYYNGCDSTSLPVTVLADTPFAAPITGGSGVCTGLTTSLADITPGGVWSSSDGSLATVSGTGVVLGGAPGNVTISYTVTNACGSASATHAMTVSAPVAVAPITGTFNTCTGATTLLSNTTPSGVWSSLSPSIATVSSTGTVSGVTGGTATISYSVTNPFGCVSAASAIVTVNVSPIATTSPAGPQVICSGATIAITASPIIAGYTYQWQDGGVNIPGATTTGYTTGVSGNYRILITSPTGCTGTSAVVNVTASTTAVIVPSVSIASSAGLVICSAPIPVTYTATPVNGGSTPAYQWYVNGVLTSGIGSVFTYTPADGDIVKCRLTSSSACAVPASVENSVTMLVTLPVTPSVIIDATPNDTVCIHDPVTYSAIPVFGGTAPSYAWTENGISVATGPTYSTVPSNGDVIICHIASNFPCLATTTGVSTPFIMTVQTPVANTVSISASSTSIVAGANVTFVALAPNGGPSPVYQWFIGTVAVPGATSATFTTNMLSNGNVVRCKVTSSLVCAAPETAMSGGFTINVIGGGTGVDATLSNQGEVFRLQPNPNKGSFTITGTLAANSNEAVSIVITNMLGETVYTGSAQTVGGKLHKQVNLENGLASGIYLVNVTSGQAHAVLHMVKE